MKKRKIGLIVFPLLFALSIVTIVMGEPTGGLRIDPPLPEPSGTTAEFSISVIPSAVPTHHPHILLVITDSCHTTIGPVSVAWAGGSITITSWHSETVPSVKVPYAINPGDPIATTGAGYTVASLMDHLETTAPIWWACESILDDNDIGEGGATITVSFTSSHPKMLVYIMGSTSESNQVVLDTRVPPTIPGFMIPELPLGTITAVALMLGALTLAARKLPIIFR